MKEIDYEGIGAFVDIAWYNGELEVMDHIVDSLAYAIKHDTYASKPDWDKIYDGRWISDEDAEVFWMWLVLMYGDYGTSPRSGWIDKMYTEPLLNVISESLADYRDGVDGKE